MEYEANYTKVGGMLVVILALIALATLYLSKSFSATVGKKFFVEFRNESLSGLQVDGAVTMRGVKIGRVRGLHIPQDDIEAVRVLIEVEKNTPIKVDTRAVLLRNLLTGLANIDLVGGTQHTSALTDKLEGREYPLISTGVDDMDQLKESLPDVMTSASGAFTAVQGVTAKLEPFLSSDNAQNFKQILSNAESFSKDISRITNKLETSAERLSLSVEKTANITNEFFMSQAQAIAQLIRQLDVTAKELQKFLEEFGSPRELLANRDGLPPAEDK